MRNKMRCPFWIAVGLATAVCWGGASLDAWSGEEGLTHAQKVDLARKVISAEPFVSGLGVQDDPFQFAKMSDTELRQYQQRVDRGLQSALAKHHSATETLGKYESDLISQGKTTYVGIAEYHDPSGKLQKLRDVVKSAGNIYRDYLIAKIDLQEETVLRKNPDDFLEADRELAKYRREASSNADYWEKLLERLELEDPQAKRLVEEHKQQDTGGRSPYAKEAAKDVTEPICGVRKGASKTQSNLDQKLQSIAQSSDVFEVTYADIYGPNANPQLIPIVEAEQLRRLPAELRDGVPRNIQRIFMYGGYENLSREAKTHVRRATQQFKDSIQNKELLTSEFEEVMARAEGSLAPEMLSAEWGKKSTAKAECAAMFLVYIVQKASDYSYGTFRENKWREAYNKVAGEIPEGKREKVIFLEEVQHGRLEMFSWLEVLDVSTLRGEMDVENKDEVFEKLKNLRGGYNPNPSPNHYVRLYSATVTGTGERIDEMPSVFEAKKAGMDMGRLARGGKLSTDIVRKTYTRYNKWEATREAFKEGYRHTAEGLIE